MLLDSSVHQQTYVEDCEVCCNPIELTAEFRDNELVGLKAVDLGQ